MMTFQWWWIKVGRNLLLTPRYHADSNAILGVRWWWSFQLDDLLSLCFQPDSSQVISTKALICCRPRLGPWDVLWLTIQNPFLIGWSKTKCKRARTLDDLIGSADANAAKRRFSLHLSRVYSTIINGNTLSSSSPSSSQSSFSRNVASSNQIKLSYSALQLLLLYINTI
jgi:hypothetical protein